MRRLLFTMAMLLTMACPVVYSQTTVNLTVQDVPDNQTWNNGTWSVQLIPGPGNLDQTRNFTLLVAGGSLGSQSGSLSSTGTASMSLPANVNIGPVGTKWQFTVCSQQGTACSISNVTVTTSSPQAVALTPPSIRVAALPNLPPVLVYTTTEISSASIGSQITVVGSTPSTPTLQTCAAVSGSTCTTWASAGGGSPFATPVYVSTNCGALTSSTTPPCFSVNDNVQYAVTATYTAGGTGGSTATLLTTNNNDTGAQFLNVTSPTSNFGSIFTGSTGSLVGVMAAFKVATSPSFGTCVGSNEGGPGSSVAVAITATGGSGHLIIAFARLGGVQSISSVTFSDNSGQNTWANVLATPSWAQTITTQMGYTTNAKAGTYTITATWPVSTSFNSIFACEVSGMATANVLDAATRTNTGDQGALTTYYGGTITTTANDLVIHAVSQNGTGGTYTVGTIGVSPNTITTTSSDPPFSCPGNVFPCSTGGDVGKKLLLTSTCSIGDGEVPCLQASPYGNTTIVTVNTAHNITPSFLPIVSNTAPASGSPPFTGYLVWGSEDGPTLATAFAKAITLPNATLFLPCGGMMFNTAPFVIPSTTFLTYNPNISGCLGTAGTLLVPSPDYPYGSAVGGLVFSYPNTNDISTNSTVQGPFLYSTVEKLDIWGGGSAGSLASWTIPVFNLTLVLLRDVDIQGWPRTGTSGGITMSSSRLRNVHLWAVGGGSTITVNGAGIQAEPSSIEHTYINSRGNALLITSGHLVTKGLSAFSGTASCTLTTSAVQQTGGEWDSYGDLIMSGIFSTGGSAYLHEDANFLSGCPGTGATINNAGGSIAAENTRIDTFTQSSGTFVDLSNNYHTAIGTPWTTGTLSVTGGTVVGTGSITGVSITAPKLVLSAGWGTTAAWTSLSGFTKRVQGTITASGTGQAANPTITYTFPTPFAQATNIVCKGTQIGGTQAAVANPFTVGTPSATSVVFTYTGTPGVGSTLQVILECDAI